MSRHPSHAGSWYSDDPDVLNRQLTSWLDEVAASDNALDGMPFTPPIPGCRAIVAPHAGYDYSGATAAWAYKSIDTTTISRVFVLGPSHHVYLTNCALPIMDSYETPIGPLPLDLNGVLADLRKTDNFSDMSRQTDEDEHSIEMHLPFIRKVFEGRDIKIVPILVGALSHADEVLFGQLLAPYLEQQENLFVISSDFCHWGTRFSYTFYYPKEPPADGIRLDRGGLHKTSIDYPIHKSITALDHEAMDITGAISQDNKVHQQFSQYLTRTKNTICGRHPIGVLLAAMESVDEPLELRWVRYAQSSACMSVRDSSVSYASGYVSARV